jgi:hypothetical protein
MKIPLVKVNAAGDASIIPRIVRTATKATALLAPPCKPNIAGPKGIEPQCEIIQGLLPGKLLAPFLPRLVLRIDFPVQQAHPAP